MAVIPKGGEGICRHRGRLETKPVEEKENEAKGAL